MGEADYLLEDGDICLPLQKRDSDLSNQRLFSISFPQRAFYVMINQFLNMSRYHPVD